MLDLAPPDPALDDGGPPGACTDQSDGTLCAVGICLGGICRASECGDRFVDLTLGEECDGGPGCEDCRWTCACPEPPACVERVDCVVGECTPVAAADDTDCTLDGAPGRCRSARCVPRRCGDGVVDADEICDDGNEEDDDGCDRDCTPSCVSASDCGDGDACNGAEECRGDVCTSGPVVRPDDCQICLRERGNVVLDLDRDGAPADRGQACTRRFDCDDENPAVFPGATEVCDGVDNDCDGARDEGLSSVLCASDVDRDGYPGSAAAAFEATCESSCPAGSAPLRQGSSGQWLLDCWDVADAYGPRVNPAQTQYLTEPYCTRDPVECPRPFDYDCDGVEQPIDTRVGPNCDLLNLRGCRGEGWIAPVPACGEVGLYATCRAVLLLTCGSERDSRRMACR